MSNGHGASNYEASWWPSFERLVRSRHSFPNATFVNGAVHSTDSTFAMYCLDVLLPASVDVVFIEFDLNNAQKQNEGATRSVELLVRKVLRLPTRRPAVVLVHVPSGNQQRFVDSIADAENVLVPYYGLSSISLRDVYWHYGIDDVWAGPHTDHRHPGDLGCAIMAELAARLISRYTSKGHLRDLEDPPIP